MFPDELKSYRQWVIWRSVAKGDGTYTKIPYCPHNPSFKAESDNAATWSSFDEAVIAAKRLVCGIGFVLTTADPYAFIDLDAANGNVAIQERQTKIEQAFDSYSEFSPSQQGIHIIVRGSVPKGRRRDKVEVYSSGRYMTMTGNTYRNKPIEDREALLRILWEEIGGSGDEVIEVRQDAQKYEDSAIYDTACNAINGDKFLSLWNGHWLDAGYNSQSEADFALINMLGFYSRNIPQIERMFHYSALGKREKAYRKGYLEKMINRSFDNQTPIVDVEAIVANTKKELDLPAPEPYIDFDYTNPEGLVGEIASFIYESSPRKVKEVAIAAALGMMAGICGRSYNISRTGLNQYILLLAKTGTGKDSLGSGIDRIVREVRKECPSAGEFIGPSAIASGQALIRHLANHPCFVSIIGEFGLMLQSMCSFHANPSQILLRKAMLELYMKSGQNEILRGTIYSDKDKNVPVVGSPSFSILGESTPEAYYQGLDENMIAQGLLPRFLCIEFKGKVPHLNKQHHAVKPDPSMITRLADLAANCHMLMTNSRVVDVGLDDDAQEFSDNFSRTTTDNINNSEITIAKELWNRAHLKVLKVAALLAVGRNAFAPVVSLQDMQWAHTVIERDIKNVFHRFEGGQIGKETNETNQIGEVEQIVKDYILRAYDDIMVKYGVDTRMHADRVITWSYLQKRVGQRGAFRNDRVGATVALRRVVESFLMDGSIREVRQLDMSSRYQASAKGFAIVEIHRFINLNRPSNSKSSKQ